MNIGAMSVGGMPNNIKGYDNIMMPGVLRMRHTQLSDHKSCIYARDCDGTYEW